MTVEVQPSPDEQEHRQRRVESADEEMDQLAIGWCEIGRSAAHAGLAADERIDERGVVRVRIERREAGAVLQLPWSLLPAMTTLATS